MINLDESNSKKLSDEISEIEYILIDTPDSIPLIQPYKIVIYDSLIFLEDQELDNLNIYDKSGNFKKQIASKGGGPKEFNQLEDFQILKNKIIIKDIVSGKLINFDFKGNYISEEKSRIEAANFIKGEDYELYYFNYSPIDSLYNFRLISKNSKSFVPYDKNYIGMGLVSLTGFIFSSTFNKYYYSIPYSYQVAEFDLNGNLTKIIEFDFGKYSVEANERILLDQGKSISNSENGYIMMIDSFFPIGSKFVLTVTNEKNLEKFLIIIDEKTNQIYIGKDLQNDIDGLQFTIFPWTYYDEGIILKYPSSTFLKLYNSSEKINNNSSNLNSFIKKNESKLAKDNHVLIRLKLKSL